MSASRPPLPAPLALLAALIGLLAVGATWAQAAAAQQIAWGPCTEAGFQCARVDVPLDRSGAVPGTISLNAERVPASSNPTNSAVVALAGGPGQAATPLAGDFAKTLRAAIATRDLLVFDQRGTGGSGALDCPALHSGGSLLSMSDRCAQQLGPQRAFYRTPDSVEDIEALRVAAGYDKLVLFGVSYGTKVALAYAAAHPDHVEALVLDSVVLPEGPDVFRRSTFQATPRVLRDLCAHHACAAATPSVSTDLRRLTAKLRSHTLTGTVINTSGQRQRASLGQTGLALILLAGDLNPTLRAELPGSMRAALRGDATPLLRLSVRSAGLSNGRQSAVADSDALFLATTCEEAPFPWARGAGVSAKAKQITAAAEAIPRGQLGPFSPKTALQAGTTPLCLGWPTASPAPPAPGPLPVVPTLVLDGQMDVRTPIEDAAQIPQRIPGAQLVEIPFTGHSVLGSDQSSCAADALTKFFTGQSETPCAAGDNPYSPTPKPPLLLAQLKPRGGNGRLGRTLAAIRATMTDASRQVLGEAIALDRVPPRVGGLRAGTVSTRVSPATIRLRLRGYQYLPGVTVSGTFNQDGAGTLTVRGGGALRGKVTFSASGATRGTLGGKRVITSVASAKHRFVLSGLRGALQRPRFGR